MKSVRDVDVRNKRVFLRVDFNVPIVNGRIIDGNRIKSALPTIKYLIDAGAKIIIGTHLGRPEGKIVPELSVKPVAAELARLLNRKVTATDAVAGEEVLAMVNGMVNGDILLLGNLRFDPGEDQNNEGFAESLARLAEIYVNDGFAVSHRSAASIVAITKFLPSYAGLLLESEITTLGLLLLEPLSPFILIIGGAKIKDKIGMIGHLAEKVQKILVGGAVANTLLAASGADVGKSLYEPDETSEYKRLLLEHGSKIVLPSDGVRAAVSGGFAIMDIGPNTVKSFIHEISKAKTILWNGNLGKTEDPLYAFGTKSIASAIIAGKETVTSVAAGGDTAGFLNASGLSGGFSFISTGGGAALSFLAGENLPGIIALEQP